MRIKQLEEVSSAFYYGCTISVHESQPYSSIAPLRNHRDSELNLKMDIGSSRQVFLGHRSGEMDITPASIFTHNEVT